MGKLIRRLFHGLLPRSWTMRLKISDSSPRRLLPFFRAITISTSKSVMTSQNSGQNSGGTNSSVIVGTSSNKEVSTVATVGLIVGTSSNNETSTVATVEFTTKTEENRERKTISHVGGDKKHEVVIKSGMIKRKSEYLEDGSSHSWCSKRARKASTAETVSAELPDCLCEMVGDTSAVVKYVEDPDQELWESMVEMIVGNELWELHNLECLLYCYLSLNEPFLHHTIERTFLQVLCDLESTS